MNPFDTSNNANDLPNNLPPQVVGFKNRKDELEKLNEYIRKHLWRVVVWGEGGIGKTSLILEYIHKLIEMQRFDAVVWTSCKKNELGAPEVTIRNPYLMNIDDTKSKKEKGVWVDSFDDFLLKILEVSQHPNYDMFLKQEAPTVQEVVDWLSFKKVIVVIDDLDSWKDWYEYLDFAEQVPSLSSIFIISSRQLFDLEDYPGMAPLKVGPVSIEESKKLLEYLLEEKQIDLTNSEHGKVIKFADGNPLIIKLSVALIENKLRQLTIEKGINKFLRRRSELPISELLGRFSGEPAGKFLVDDIYRDLSNDAKDVVLVLAVLNKVFPNRPIFDKLSLLVNLSPSSLTQILKELEMSSLVNRKGYDQNPQDMHEVVRDLILQKNKSSAEKITKMVTEMFP